MNVAQRWKYGVWAVIGIVALVVGIYLIQWHTAEPRGRLDAREQIFDGSNIIAKYDMFYADCGQIRASQQNLVNLRAQLDDLKGRARQNMMTTISGIEYQLTQAINKYETDAAATYTGGQFRDARLPYTIPEKGIVVCVD